MKQTRLVVCTTFIMICAFAAVMYTSCTKDACSGVTCKNGGTCTNGVCSCPTGYSGNACEESLIIFINNTYTPISITVNNEKTILAPSKGFASFAGTAGAAANVVATTSVTNDSGKTVGEVVTWSFTDTFPTGGKQFSHTLDVGKDYFYLKMANADNHDSVVYIKVNYGTPYEHADSIQLPNNGHTYVIGYYKAFPDTKIYAQGYLGGTWVLDTQIPNEVNAYTIVSVP